MSDVPDKDPRNAGIGPSDEDLLKAHEALSGSAPDDKGHYRLAPLLMLLVMSAFILFAGTYLNRYAGRYSASVYDGNARAGAPVAVQRIDPMVLGERQFGSACITCHQATGLGVPGAFPPLAGSSWVNGSEERVIRIVLYGLKDQVHVSGAVYGAAVMPTFGQVANSGYNWSDEQIAAVLTYVRGTWGNKAPAVTPESVSRIRKLVGDRPPWTEGELLQVK